MQKSTFLLIAFLLFTGLSQAMSFDRSKFDTTCKEAASQLSTSFEKQHATMITEQEKLPKMILADPTSFSPETRVFGKIFFETLALMDKGQYAGLYTNMNRIVQEQIQEDSN